MDQVKYKLEACLVHSSVDRESNVWRPYLVRTSLLQHSMDDASSLLDNSVNPLAAIELA